VIDDLSAVRSMFYDGPTHCRGRTTLTRRQNVTGCLNFAKSHFAIPDSEVACLWQNFNKLPSILPPRQNNPVAAVTASVGIARFGRKFVNYEYQPRTFPLPGFEQNALPALHKWFLQSSHGLCSVHTIRRPLPSTPLICVS